MNRECIPSYRGEEVVFPDYDYPGDTLVQSQHIRDTKVETEPQTAIAYDFDESTTLSDQPPYDKYE